MKHSLGRVQTGPQLRGRAELDMDKVSSEDAVKCVPQLSDTETCMRTSDVYRVSKDLPKRFNHPDCFKGYGRNVHPLYQTTNQTYGSQKPTVHEMPTSFHGSRRTFSEDFLKSGMFRDNGFNTALEKSRVTGPSTVAMLHDKIIFHLSQHIARNNKTESSMD
ncbi:piercer of microtubule wall 2 protein [Brachyhypopomus gauderio]|uniref:piercer of microtubule wall 2 protein n=1 Tax=Brachyhypopomus gauderio TaxID=698409 RepID=UPI0040427987